MKLYDSPDPRLAAPMCPWAKEPVPISSRSLSPDDPFRMDWINNAINTSSNMEDVLFIAFGGAF